MADDPSQPTQAEKAARFRALHEGEAFVIPNPWDAGSARALEALGFVSREPDPADGRAWLIRLTEQGGDRLRSVRNARRARYVDKLANWNRTEVAELARLLHQLNEAAGVEY